MVIHLDSYTSNKYEKNKYFYKIKNRMSDEIKNLTITIFH